MAQYEDFSNLTPEELLKKLQEKQQQQYKLGGLVSKFEDEDQSEMIRQ